MSGAGQVTEFRLALIVDTFNITKRSHYEKRLFFFTHSIVLIIPSFKVNLDFQPRELIRETSNNF